MEPQPATGKGLALVVPDRDDSGIVFVCEQPRAIIEDTQPQRGVVSFATSEQGRWGHRGRWRGHARLVTAGRAPDDYREPSEMFSIFIGNTPFTTISVTPP